MGWLYQSLEIMARSPEGELCVAENTAAIRAVATVLRASAGELEGRPDLSDRGQAGKQPVQRLERARETAAQMLARRVAEQPQIPDEQALQAQVDRGFRVYTASYTARQIATYARAASPHPDGPPIDGVPGPAELAAAATAAAASAEAGPDPLTGEVPASRRWTGWMRSWLLGAEGFTATHADYRSVWFRNSVRGAVGLAIAVFIAQKSGLQHSFWVVLGTLSVLRSNALGTGRTIVSALAGTAAGILVGAAILIPVGGNQTVLWAILPVAVLIAAYAPRAVSFAAGQAAFTVVILILFNIIQPVGWKVGLIRIEDVAIGFAVSLGVGLVFWPRGAARLLRENIAVAYSRAADYFAAAAERLTGGDQAGDPGHAGDTATAAVHQLEDSFRQYLAERSAKRVDPESAGRIVAGAGRVLRAGRSMAALDPMAETGRTITLEGTTAGNGSPVRPDPGPNPGPPNPVWSGAARCGVSIDREIQALRSWYVTLGDSIVNGTAVPRPQPPDPDGRRQLLQCVRDAIVSGEESELRGALLVLWASHHLDVLRHLESHLGQQAAAAAGKGESVNG
jgi:hypothetical protein